MGGVNSPMIFESFLQLYTSCVSFRSNDVTVKKIHESFTIELFTKTLNKAALANLKNFTKGTPFANLAAMNHFSRKFVYV